jgi:hypothetical protein
MKIKSSHLALRFYVSDGWTMEEVQKYCIRGTIHPPREEDKAFNLEYFTPDVNSIMDNLKMLGDGHQVYDYNGRPLEELTAYNYLKGF